jgi:hypothetical protein
MPTLLRDAPYYGHRPAGTGFFTGTSPTTELVPHVYHCSLGGRPYMVDFSQPFYRQYRRQLNQIIRTQADTSTDPGEQTMDPNSMWRRSFEDWSLGAQQRYLDRHDSQANRFWTSKGIDALTTKWQISLLADVKVLRASANSNLKIREANGYLYIADGNQLLYTSAASPGTWTAVTGTPTVTISSMATDGYNIWAAFGASGLYHTTAGSATAADQYVTGALGPAAVVSYMNGRLMIGDGPHIYNIVAADAALPAPLFTAGNPSFVFVSFAEGENAIYAAGNAGDRCYIYGMSVTSDGTVLGAPVVQGQLSPGETCYALYGYLNFLMVGTSMGARMCTTAANGAIGLGTLIPTPRPVRAFIGWQRFCYFDWSDYDSVSTGLGRMDLQNHVVAGLLPAVCSDLMAPGGGLVTSVWALASGVYFSVAGAGFYVSDPTHLVAAGTVDSGLILYDLTDPKTAAQLDVSGPIAAGSYSAAISVNGSAFTVIGTHAAGQPEPVTFGCGPRTGQSFDIQFTLYRDATNPAVGPVVNRWTLRSYPAPNRPLSWQVPLILNEVVTNLTDGNDSFDPLVELMALEAMADLGQMVTFQEGPYSHPVFVTDIAFYPDYPTRDRHFFNGMALLTLQGLPPGAN